MSDIDTVTVDSLKALDPNRPIREADIEVANRKTASRRSIRHRTSCFDQAIVSEPFPLCGYGRTRQLFPYSNPPSVPIQP